MQFFSPENDFGFLFFVDLTLLGLDEVLNWSRGLDLVGDDLIGEVFNIDG